MFAQIRFFVVTYANALELKILGSSWLNPRLGFPAMLNYFIAVPWKTTVPPGLCVLQEYPSDPSLLSVPMFERSKDYL